MTKSTIGFTIKIKRKVLSAVLIITFLVFIATTAYLFLIPTVDNNIRKDRIIAIYNSLNLDEQKYLIQKQSIFGVKKFYSYDTSRTHASMKEYIRGANVDTTVAELKQALASAGFTFYENPYPESSTQYLHYKSAKNEYIHITVSSKLRDDAFFNSSYMNQSPVYSDFESMANSGPSDVIINVNLDDNNS